MLDENYKAWLIEINNNPSMSIKHESGFMDSKFSEPSPIDAEIKKPLLHFAIKGARKFQKLQLEDTIGLL